MGRLEKRAKGVVNSTAQKHKSEEMPMLRKWEDEDTDETEFSEEEEEEEEEEIAEEDKTGFLDEDYSEFADFEEEEEPDVYDDPKAIYYGDEF